jgi:hypothetical protein
MKVRPIVPMCLAILMFALTVHLYMKSVFLLGFPDGFIAELDGAEATLVTVFNWITILMALWFIYLGIVAFRRDIRKRFFISCAIYSAVIAVSVAVDLYFRAHLTDSAGG